MSIIASYYKHTLKFKFDAGTSRGILKEKDSYILKLEKNGVVGYGEAGPLFGLSLDFGVKIERAIIQLCKNINTGLFSEEDLRIKYVEYPSLVFAIETAFLDLKNKGKRIIFYNDFALNGAKISINGLIWMGEKSFMIDQIKNKIKEGYKIIKLKIGALDFETELEILKYIRARFSENEIELRVDANGAFKPKNALEKLKRLSEFRIHSIEQPIATNQLEKMADLCQTTPIPIALDEELIGKLDFPFLLETVKPQYIILKPTLIGGFKISKNWIIEADKRNIGWWITSALESNIGLNAIAQFTAEFPENNIPHGLGTGKLFHNNIDSPLYIENGKISLKNNLHWYIPF